MYLIFDRILRVNWDRTLVYFYDCYCNNLDGHSRLMDLFCYGIFQHFLHALEKVTPPYNISNSHCIMLYFSIIFPIVHLGLSLLHPYGEKNVDSRMWRVIFSFSSLCLLYGWTTYFIAYAHNGKQFYNL